MTPARVVERGPTVRLRPLAPLLTLTLPIAVASCQGCDRNKPYVPYTIDPIASVPSGAPDATASAAPPASGSPSASAATRIPGTSAPPGATTWTLAGLAMAAPPGRVFAAGVPFDGPEPQALVFATDGAATAGDLLLYRGAGAAPTHVGKLPDWMPGGAGCQHQVQLARVGKATASIEVIALCKSDEPRRPHRWAAAVAVGERPGVRFELRAAEIPNGARLSIEPDASDRDADGMDDLTVTLALEGMPLPLPAGGGARATLTLKLLGRDGALTREPSEPAASLGAIGRWVAAQAAKRDKAEDSMASAIRLRVLASMACAEAGSPIVTLADGAPISCGDLGAALEDLRLAEARALASLGRVGAAAAVTERLRAARPKSKRAADADAAVDAAATPRKAKARPLRATPVPSDVALSLSFEPGGKLLVLTESGVVRVDPSTLDEEPAAGVAAWSPRAELAGALRLDGGADTCKTERLRVHVRGESNALRELLLPRLGGSAPLCPPSATARAVLLDRDADGAALALLGEPLRVSADGERVETIDWPRGAPRPGTARSPDGQWTALALGDRVLLRGPGKWETWRPQPFFTLNACVAADDAKAVACALDKGAVLLTP